MRRIRAIKDFTASGIYLRAVRKSLVSSCSASKRSFQIRASCRAASQDKRKTIEIFREDTGYKPETAESYLLEAIGIRARQTEVKDGMFHNEGIELLIRYPAGEKNEQDEFPEDFVNGRVYKKLKAFSGTSTDTYQ